MLDIFKKNNNSGTNPIKNLINSFSGEQKSIFIGAITLIANADGEISANEIAYLNEISNLMQIDMNDPIHLQVSQGGYPEMQRIFKTFNTAQKEMFLISIHEMILADGKADDNEITYALVFAKELGYSEDEYFEIIHKSSSIKNLLSGR
jgi:uncharacterized tellurite resistance protein B-like protein